MFSKNARELFEIMDKNCSAQGVFENEALVEALEKLKAAVNTNMMNVAFHEVADEKEKNDNEEEEEPISLRQRAQPLIRLMERTWKAGGFILWEAPQAF